MLTKLGRSVVARAASSAGRSSSGVRTENPAAPQDVANAAKSGLTRLVCQTGRMAPSCSRLILARPWAWRRIVEARQLLHVVREHQVGDVALHDGVLHGEGREVGGIGRRQDRLTPLGHGVERLLERQLLERARSDDLRLHLSGERQDRDAIDLGIPQPGEQVRGPWAGDGEAGRRVAGQLGVARRGKGCCAFVTDSDVGEAAISLRLAKRVGHPQVRVADHPEHGLESPVAQDIDDLIHEARRRLVGRDLDFDRGVVTVDGTHCVGRRRVTKPRRRLAGSRVVRVGVPRADQPPRRAGRHQADRPGAGNGCRALSRCRPRRARHRPPAHRRSQW